MEIFGKYLALTNEKFHLRTAHSKLNGFWLHELGGLNSVSAFLFFFLKANNAG